MKLSLLLSATLTTGLVASVAMSGCRSKTSEDEVAADTTVSAPVRKRLEIPMRASESVVYVHRTSGDLSLDLYKPPPEKDKHLAVVLIHGGGWVGGNRAQMGEIASYISAKGFFAVSIDYRLAPKDIWPTQIQDAQAAVRFVRTNAKKYGVNPDKIAAAGVSAGGHLSMLLGDTDSFSPSGTKEISGRVQAVGSISGIHDLNLKLTHFGDAYRIVQSLMGEKGAPDREKRSKASPITYVDKKTAPTMFIHGNSDPLVPVDQAKQAAEKLKQVGVPTDAILLDDMGHGLSPSVPSQAAALDKLCDWFEKYLK